MQCAGMSTSREAFLQRRADEMRADQTKAEKALGRILKAGWTSQVPLCGDYIADFYHAAYRAVVEADGGYHTTDEQQAKDRSRDAAMASHGLLVMRFTNRQIIKQTPWVADSIRRQIDTQCKALGIPLPPMTRTAA